MDNTRGILYKQAAGKSAGDAVRAAMSPGIDHDDVVVLFELFGDAQPGQPVFIEAMQEQQCGLLTSRAIVVVTYAIGEDIALAPVCREKFNDGTICFHK